MCIFFNNFFIEYFTYFFKSTETGFNSSASISAKLSISNLSTPAFKLAKSSFFTNYESAPAVFFKSDFVA